jgi:L,D-transpeptidase catalytic domain
MAGPASASSPDPSMTPSCDWWLRNCGAAAADALPPEAPREGVVITVAVEANLVRLFSDGKLVAKAPAATGSERYLQKGSREWKFHTPRGHMKVVRKIVDPVWVKPDWGMKAEGRKQKWISDDSRSTRETTNQNENVVAAHSSRSRK